MGQIYISSTFEDLQDQREAVYHVLRRQGHDVVAMEDYVARDERPLDRCLADVRGCDVYVGLFAFRYGYVPVDQPEAVGRSITELEYREAGKERKERLCFILDKRAPWPLDLVDEDRRAVTTLRSELEAAHSVAMFRNTEELCTRVLEAVVAWEKRVGYVPPAGAQSSTLDVGGYARKIRERYGRVELDALVPPERDEQLRIPLDAVFVEQTVRADRPPVELPKELWEKLQQAGEISAEDLPKGVTPADLEAAGAAFRARPTVRVFDALSGNDGSRVVLLGDPGAGKSTLTRYLLLSLLDPDGDSRARAAFPDVLPLIVELRKFAGLRAEGRCETFLDYFALLGRTEGFCLTAEALTAHLYSDAPTLVIFDGLDELFDPGVRETVTHQIAGFASDHPRVRVLVTSRILGYSPKSLSDAGFVHFTLQDLGPPEIGRFLSAWFGRVLADRPDDAVLRKQRILTAVEESRSIRMIAGNPMLLTIMAIIGKNQELPRERAELYHHAATVLVEHWDVKKHLVEAALEIAFDRQEKLELLRRVAWAMQAAPGGLAGNYIQDERLLEVIRDFIHDQFGEALAQARRIAGVMIRQLRERNFILCLYGAGLYGFVHRSFLEFFCASAIQRQFEKTQELSLDQLKRDVYGTHWEDHAWREVLRLVAGLIEPRFAGEVIEHLALELYREWPENFDERPPRNLALAVECLGEVRNLLALDDIGERLLRRLIALLEHGDGMEDDARNSMLINDLIPAVDSVGERWPGRGRLQDWFWQKGPRIVWYPLSQVWCHMMAALYFSDRRTLPFLVALAEHDDPRMKRAAFKALVEKFRRSPDIFPALEKLARSQNLWTSESAVTILVQQYHDHPETRGLIKEFLERNAVTMYSEFPGVLRLAFPDLAVELLARLSRTARESSSPRVRTQMVRTLLHVTHLDFVLLRVASRDLDGGEPFFDPWNGIPAGHLKRARAMLGASEDEWKQVLADLTKALGWDPRKRLRPKRSARGHSRPAKKRRTPMRKSN